MNEQLKLFLYVGAPGSGKSTYGKNMVFNDPNIVRVCPDEIRAKIGWGEGDQSVSGIAFAVAKKEIGKFLAEGKSVIFDATNMYRKTRKDFINIGRGHGAKVIAVVFECDKQTLLERNTKRGNEGGRVVPEEVIESMIAKYQRPDNTEFDKITFI